MVLLLTRLFTAPTAIIHSPVGRNKAGKGAVPIRFCDARYKDKAAAVRGSRKGVVMTPYLKNCAVYLYLFS
ncbi:hypothetical protein DXC40_17410 [Anaerotruncus colihominis]|uniref:Uncharacterized protein n=1 Tax=Anaerotruncus colihominis TaxID=169435 RepID=A0A3E3IE65_9FIRM|nr:hypothetical protein DXC40_17410 [Anaerotruncus colihominis]